MAGYCGFSFLRAPHVFLGRFWAEEGLYYGLFQKLSAFNALIYAGAGYPMFLTNGSVLLAELLPVKYAPFITTALGLGALFTLVAMILLWSDRLGMDKMMAGIIASIIIVLPHTAEVTANATNLQWIAASIGVVVLLLPAEKPQQFSWCVLFLAGLAGPASILLAPSFALKCALDRSRSSWIQLACLLVPAAIITAVMLETRQLSTRSYPLDPDLYVSVLSTQSAMTLFFGFDVSLAITSWYRAAPSAPWVFLIKIASTAVVLTAFLIGLAIRDTRRASVLLASAYFISVFAGVFAAINPYELINPLSRYIFAPNIMLLLLLGIVASRVAPLIGTIMFVAVLAVHTLPNKIPAFLFDGPSWRAQIPDGEIRKPTEVEIWPNGWTVTLLPR